MAEPKGESRHFTREDLAVWANPILLAESLEDLAKVFMLTKGMSQDLREQVLILVKAKAGKMPSQGGAEELGRMISLKEREFDRRH